jgi:hypothetical protein
MASAKFGMNLAFAGLVVLLALTALTSIYFKVGNADNHRIETAEPSANPLMGGSGAG